jgi:hypothetical protein
MQFHGDRSKTYQIHGSWSNIYRRWRKFQCILSMMPDGLSSFTVNSEKINLIYKFQGIFAAWKQRFQAILSLMAETLSNFMANSEKLTQFTNLEAYFQHQSREFKQY